MIKTTRAGRLKSAETGPNMQSSDGSNWRHEEKFLMDEDQFFFLYARLAALLPADPHAHRQRQVPDKTWNRYWLRPEQIWPSYRIRSLYFDTLHRQGLFEKLSGIDPRDKYRLRLYPGSESIRLEKKCKHGQLTYKQGLLLDQDQSIGLIERQFGFLMDLQPPGPMFYAAFATHPLFPVLLVDYQRFPLFWPDGNVRITFDRDLTTGLSQIDLFSPEAAGYGVLPPGKVILEIKYDRFLPDFIRGILPLTGCTTLAISKYALCSKPDSWASWSDPS